MALIVADRVVESSTSTGTGNFALAGAYTGYRAFDDVMANGDTCYYCIEAVDANGNPSGAWETGLGTFNDTDTLVRTSVHASSNSNNAVDFAAGNKRVMLDVSAARLSAFLVNSNNLSDVSNASTARSNLGLALGSQAQAWDADLDALAALSGTNTLYYRSASNTWSAVTVSAPLRFTGGTLSLPFVGCSAKLSADATTQNYSTSTAIPWDGADEFDTDGFHNPASNNTRMTIPDLTATYGKKAAKVTVFATVSTSNATASDWVALRINKNGSALIGGPFLIYEGGSTSGGGMIVAHDIPVTGDGTDYFEVLLQVESDTSITVSATRTNFKVKVTDWQ